MAMAAPDMDVDMGPQDALENRCRKLWFVISKSLANAKSQCVRVLELDL